MDNKVDYETLFRNNIANYLREKSQVDEVLPEAPDIEALWASIGEAYLPDAIREFNDYPKVVLGWIMYVGMAVAKFWDADWERYSQINNIYIYLRDKRDYDHLDDYIKEEVLQLDKAGANLLQDIVSECAARVYNQFLHLSLQSGTEPAFRAFVAALHEMYRMGAAMQLRRMGYHMTSLRDM